MDNSQEFNDDMTKPKHISHYVVRVLSSFKIEQFFKDCLAREGHAIDTPLHPATKASSFTRFNCPNRSGKNKHGAYKAYFDGRPTIFFQCHACATGVMKFTFKMEFSAGERRDYAKKMKEQQLNRIAAEKKAKEERGRAWRAMITEWNTSKSCISHPYFNLKQVTVTDADDLRINSKGHLLSPIRSISGDLISLQRIYWDKEKCKFEKRFFSGLPVGGFHVFGNLVSCDTIFLGEGIATCLTIREASGCSVICAYGKRFDSIAKIIRNKYPKAKLTFCCDISTNPNERITSENNAKMAIDFIGENSLYLLPNFTVIGVTSTQIVESNLTDFNDLFSELLRSGLERTSALDIVRQQLSTNYRGTL